MDDFTALLVKLKDLIGLSTGNGSPKSNTSSNNFSLPNSDEFSEVVQRLTLLLAREPRLCEQIWKSITEKKNVLSASDKKSNETKGRDSFKMLTEMVVHICFTANNMLPDEVEFTNTDALMEVTLLRDTSEQLGKTLLTWTENNKREYIEELKCEPLIKIISSQINKPIYDSSKLSLKNRLTQLTEVIQQIHHHCMLHEILVDNAKKKV